MNDALIVWELRADGASEDNPGGGHAFATAEQPPGFAVTAGGELDEPVWRASLPADRAAAERCLAAAEEALERAQQTLTAPASGEQRAEPFSASFGSGRWAQVAGALQEHGARLLHLVGDLAWVETRRDGVLLARTRLGPTGSTGTVWRVDPSAAEVRQHRRTLALAVGTRGTLLRALGLTLQATTAAVLLATPATIVPGALAAWRLIARVLGELERLDAGRLAAS